MEELGQFCLAKVTRQRPAVGISTETRARISFMSKRSSLWVYDKKEMIVLVLLGGLVAAFAFTLGVHLGKRLYPKAADAAHGDGHVVATQEDADPTRQEVSEAAAGTEAAAQEAMTEALRNEVSRTGLKLDEPKQVKLPEETKAEKKAEKKVSHKEATHESTSEKAPASGAEKYALQVGSYKTANEAATLVNELQAHALEPWVQEVNLPGKGKWYRVYLGRFASKVEAEQMGVRYQDQHIIQSFVLALLDRKR